jgi:hypothetical protein
MEKTNNHSFFLSAKEMKDLQRDDKIMQSNFFCSNMNQLDLATWILELVFIFVIKMGLISRDSLTYSAKLRNHKYYCYNVATMYQISKNSKMLIHSVNILCC